MATASTYPISVSLPQEREVNRWWGLLWFGMLVRAILAIPHAIVLMILGVLLYLGMFIVWVPILLNGRVPEVWCKIAAEIINRSTRVSAYTYLFPGVYPALGMNESGPVGVSIDVGDRSINRLWGIPLVGMIARLIVVIPQIVVLYALSIAASLVALVVWIPILANGRYPDMGMKIMGWLLRYSARVGGYIAFLPVPYPPIGDIE